MCSHVSKITGVYTLDQGCTQPASVLLDGERKAVLKYPKNPMGIIVLFNEYITYSIANALCLSIPGFGIAIVDNNTFLDESLHKDYQLSCFMGTGFYCDFIPKSAPASARILKHACNLDETGKIILLDQIVKNSDRYFANMRVELSGPSPKMYIIDHSHALGDPDWDSSTLSFQDSTSPYIWRENFDLYTMLINAGAVVTPVTLMADCNAIQACVTEAVLDEIFGSLPTTWIKEIGEVNVAHAKKYILNRIQNLQVICQMINAERGV